MKELDRLGVPFRFIQIEQHTDKSMAENFLKELELKPDKKIKIKHKNQFSQIATIIERFGEYLQNEKPAMLLIEGDTNTVLATAIAANKSGVPIGHIEAGLRSYDRRTPEEHNRRLVDHLSDILFAPTQTARLNLEKEGIFDNVFVTGNPIIDAVKMFMPSRIKRRFLLPNEYGLATIHRAENVDNPETLMNLLEAFNRSVIPIVAIKHPRTADRIIRFDLTGEAYNKNIRWIPPCGYGETLGLMRCSELILTDSGGIQEEITAPVIRKFALVLRDKTERPEAVAHGFAKVVGTKPNDILLEIEKFSLRTPVLPNISPYGFGGSAQLIASHTINFINRNSVK